VTLTRVRTSYSWNGSATDAPDTYEKLKAHLDAGERLVVYSGGSQHTIYADPAVNHAFRA
jgi:hypothetical protein